MQIVAATNNAHKLVEMRNILAPLGIAVLSGRDVGGLPDVVEDGETFTANAIKKALEMARHVNRPVVADDSGLEVFALDGAPGVYSARYGGAGLDDAGRTALVLQRLGGQVGANRGARFVCVIALATPGCLIGTAKGEVVGAIALQPQGANGFGYDPVFIPAGHDRSFAEMTAAEKDGMSHRGNALKAAVAAGLFRRLKV